MFIATIAHLLTAPVGAACGAPTERVRYFTLAINMLLLRSKTSGATPEQNLNSQAS